MEQRGGNAIAKQVSNVERKTLFPIIRANAEENSSAYTDEYPVYKGLDKWYNHQVVVHKIGQYVKQYADGKKTSTNLVENFNSHLNKMIYGTYVMISRRHAQKYLDEFTFRRNMRNYSEQDRLNLLLSSTVGKRLTYRELVS
jgi:transposase-like protein